MEEATEVLVNVYSSWYKHGKGFLNTLVRSAGVEDTFRAHAAGMQATSIKMAQIADIISGHKVRVIANSKMIILGCDEKISEALVEAGLGVKCTKKDIKCSFSISSQ